ncbi:flavodoxin-dependent (E)-4-hydroxy-3-methylbut-2-enyl-diphosphate synthase, partial [Escherichia coli]
MHNQAPIQRRKSTRIYVGNVPIGDGAPIAVQSMTNTRTTDVEATVNQIKALERVGAAVPGGGKTTKLSRKRSPL